MILRFKWLVADFLIVFIALAAVVLLVVANPKPISAGFSNIGWSNVRDTTFTVSWITDVPITGTVNYGTTTALGNIANDVRGASTNSTTHYVTISGLNPNTQFYFDVISGSSVWDNGGSHLTVTTGPTLGLPGSPDPAYGLVFKVDHATFATGTIVYLTIVDNDGLGSHGSSAAMSVLIRDTDLGYWGYNLANARTTDLLSYFSYSPAGGDNLQLYAFGGADGTANLTGGTVSDKPVTPIYLDGVPTAVTLSNFTASSENISGDTILGVLAMSGSIILLAGIWLTRVRS